MFWSEFSARNHNLHDFVDQVSGTLAFVVSLQFSSERPRPGVFNGHSHNVQQNVGVPRRAGAHLGSVVRRCQEVFQQGELYSFPVNLALVCQHVSVICCQMAFDT